MKIAIPSNDKITLSPHFGRTQGFIIFQISEGKILSTEYRPNSFTHHVTGQQNQYGPHPGHGHDGHHDHQGLHGHHSHSRILDALVDCDAVIAGGMGTRLQEDLTRAGKKIIITSQTDARQAVELYLKDALVSDKDACCH